MIIKKADLSVLSRVFDHVNLILKSSDEEVYPSSPDTLHKSPTNQYHGHPLVLSLTFSSIEEPYTIALHPPKTEATDANEGPLTFSSSLPTASPRSKHRASQSSQGHVTAVPFRQPSSSQNSSATFKPKPKQPNKPCVITQSEMYTEVFVQIEEVILLR